MVRNDLGTKRLETPKPATYILLIYFNYQILTNLILGTMGTAIFDCVIRSCDLFDWFIQTYVGPNVIPAVITSLELFNVMTTCFFNNVYSVGNIIILLVRSPTR